MEIPTADKNLDLRWNTKQQKTKSRAIKMNPMSTQSNTRISSKKVTNENMSAQKPKASTVFVLVKSVLYFRMNSFRMSYCSAAK